LTRKGTLWSLIALTTVLAAACESTPPEVLDHAVRRSFAGLTAIAHVDLDRSAAISVRYWADGVPALQVLQGTAQSHEVILTRLKANHSYQYEIRTPDERNPSVAVLAEGSFSTPGLPRPLADIEFTADGTPSTPLTMLSLETTSGRSWFAIVDASGEIVWYTETAGGAAASTRLDNGWFVLQDFGGGLSVLSPDGVPLANLPQGFLANADGPAAGTRIHHDVVANSGETVLYLARSENVLGDTTWVGEQIWEWTPSTGADVLRWDAWDFLDPSVDRGPRSRPGDWLHANAMSIGADGNILVSFHALDQIISIADDFSEIEWRIGGPGSTFQVPQQAKFSGQHTVAQVSPSHVLMFDNGASRDSGELFSRALELELDFEAHAVTTAWEFRPQPDNYAQIISSARRLVNGNTLVGFGTSEGVAGSSTGPVEIYEVTQSGDVVWHLVTVGLNRIYRATPLDAIFMETVVGDF
jgi:hypothetical protein